jgi:alpha-mannosidase
VTLAYDGGGAESFGVDPNHRELPLRGRRFAISSEAVAHAPFGQPVGDPRLAEAALIHVDLAVEQLNLLLTLVAETVEALADEEVSALLLDAAETALRGLDWPSSTPEYIARIAPSRQQRTIWRLPEVVSDPPGLNDRERASVVAAYETLLASLDDLKRRFPSRGKIALSGHAHIDLAWLWPYEETRRKLRRTFHTALSLIERNPTFRFNQSTAHYYEQIERDDAKLFARIRDRAGSGAWEPIGGMWVEPDTNMPTGESFARQLLYGQRYFGEKFGKRARICWLPDCFGFSPALPQLLKQAGIASFFTIKVNWSESNKFPFDLFWWEGLDGSRVLAHTFDNPSGGYNGQVDPGAYLATWRNFRAKAFHDETLLSVGYGDGGGGVTPEMIERQKLLEHFPALPAAEWRRVDDFFSRAHKTAESRELPRWRGEMYLELHRATLTTQSGVKRGHRAAERALIVAETIQSLACLLGAKAPENFEAFWRVVLKNEFHDILPGSSIREVYQEAEAELNAVFVHAEKSQRAAVEGLAALLPSGDSKHALVVVNPSLTEQPLTLHLDDGEAFASAERLAPLSIRVIDINRLSPAPGLKASARTLENEYLFAEIGDDGAIARLVEKRSDRQALADRGNQLWVYPQDKPRAWDAWDIDEDYFARSEEVRGAESVALVENDLHFAAIRVAHRYKSSTITQTYRLAANAHWLEIETFLDWRDRRTLLRSLTPAAVRANYASCECAYGVIERPTHRNTSWEEAMFEAVAHRFVDLSEPGFGLALLNDGKYGHSVRDNMLGLSLVRSPVYPDPLADEGEQRFTYALCPHSLPLPLSGVREAADALNQPLLSAPAKGVKETKLSPLRFSSSLTALSALKAAEDGNGLILRLYEPFGARGDLVITPPPGWRLDGPLNLMEEPMAREAQHDLTPFEVRTWRLAKTASS